MAADASLFNGDDRCPRPDVGRHRLAARRDGRYHLRARDRRGERTRRAVTHTGGLLPKTAAETPVDGSQERGNALSRQADGGPGST